VTETDPLAVGVYQVRITVTDPKTGLSNNSLLIDVTVLCTKSISIVTNPIPATTIYTINTSVLMTTQLTLPTYEPTPNTCAMGTWSYSVALDPVATFPAFITENPTTTIDIATQDDTQAGTYNFRVTATDSLTSVANSDVVF